MFDLANIQVPNIDEVSTTIGAPPAIIAAMFSSIVPVATNSWTCFFGTAVEVVLSTESAASTVEHPSYAARRRCDGHLDAARSATAHRRRCRCQVLTLAQFRRPGMLEAS